jgi:predicted ArsR family transcriptional regulator
MNNSNNNDDSVKKIETRGRKSKIGSVALPADTEFSIDEVAKALGIPKYKVSNEVARRKRAGAIEEVRKEKIKKGKGRCVKFFKLSSKQ